MQIKKDSGIKWVGEIPSDWKGLKLRYICDKITDYTASGSFASLAENVIYRDYEDYAMLVRTADLSNKRETSKVYVDEHAYNYLSNSNLFGGEVILPNIGSVGEVYLYQPIYERATLAPNAIMIQAPEEVEKFLYYYFSTYGASDDLKNLGNATTQIKFNKTQLRNLKVVIPPKEKMLKINCFLDRRCEKIESFVTVVQQQIDTLEELKRSVVYEAVSKGIKKAELKDTDSDVWAKIPKDWQLVDVKYLFEIVKRIAGKEGIDILSVTQQGLKVKDISSNEGQIADNYSGYQIVYPTDYVMNHMDLLTGWVDCSTIFGVTSPDYRVFRLMDKANNSLRYYKYVMQCCYMCKIFYSLGQGVSTLGRWRLQTSSFLNFKVPAPPLKEQEIIADYIEEKVSGIERLINLKIEQQRVLEDYKKTLIADYVTGKKEVSES